MSYQIKEIFYTLQGEGANAGKPAVFCRFVGCNLWSGREADRASAVCQFCDTDFVGTDGTLGARYDSADALAQQQLNGHRIGEILAGQGLISAEMALFFAEAKVTPGGQIEFCPA